MSPVLGRARAVAIAALMGLAALWIASRRAVPGLCWNDELVYAAAGRHVADGHGPLSSFYHPDAITARGFPLPDVHMPGHAFVLGTAFRLGGATESVAILTSRLAFLGTVMLLAGALCRRWGERSALAAALLFLLFPPDAAFAHTAMSESVLTLLSTGFLALVLAARERPSLAHAIALALLLGVGVIHHETFLVYAPAAAWVVTRWPQPARTRGLLVGAGVLGACLLAAVPLYLDRAPHPHALSDVLLSGESTVERAGTMTQNLLANLRGLPFWPDEAWKLNHALQWLAVIAAGVIGFRAGGERRAVAALAILGFVGTWLLLALVYPLGDWRAVRVFMHAMPAALAVIADALARRPAPGWRARDALRVLAPAGVLAAAAVSLSAIGRDRAFNDGFGRAYAAFLSRSTAGHDVRLVVATKAYRYGWDAYPVAVVVWEATDLKRVRAVEQTLPVDAIVVRREEKRRFVRGLLDGAYRRAFSPAPTEPFHGRYEVYLAGGERPEIRSSAASSGARPPG
jgi:4-amino-4-deoxy-L-arabinose transferase-like glycosyltransferase